MRSLYSKFLVFTLITMIGSAIVAFLIVNTAYHQLLKSDNDAKNMGILENITTFIEANPQIDIHEFLQTQADVGYKLFLAHKVGDELKTETFGEPFRSDYISRETIEAVLADTDYHGMRDLPKETFVTGFFADELENSVGTSFTSAGENYALFLRPNIKMLFTEVHYLLGGIFVIMGFISLIAMLFVANRLIKPLRQLTLATEKISGGHYEVPPDYKSNDEVGQLTRSFTKMIDELTKADAMQKQFISDVSHDFQTPLQQMKGYAALIREGEISDDEKTDYLRIIERESERLSNLSRQLLVLTSLDAGRQHEAATIFSLDNQIREIVTRFRWQLERKDISLTAEIDEVMIEGDESFLEQLWENLLSNAIKYTSVGGVISLALGAEGGEIIFRISDNGIGIPEAHLPYVFDRFYRADEARSSHIEGTGLGLAIVKKIVDFHGGSIDIDSRVDVGTTISIRLPESLG